MNKTVQTVRAGISKASPPKRGLMGKFWYKTGLFILRFFTKLRFKGKDNIPGEIPYVLAANHQTFFDGMFIAKGLPKKHFPSFCALVGADLSTDYGIVGKIIVSVARPVFVNRRGNPVRGLIMAKNACLAGNILLVHPEGTRTADGKLLPLQSGAAYISIKGKVPLIPVYISGGFETYPRQAKLPRRKNPLTGKKNSMTVEFGEPMYPDNYSDAHQMTAALSRWMQAKEKSYLSELNN